MAIYIAARDLSGVPIGTHQFLIIEINSTPAIVAKQGKNDIHVKNLGNNKVGFVVGTHNKGNIQVVFFEPSDYTATKQYFSKKSVSAYQSFSTVAQEVKFSGINDIEAVKKVLTLIYNYDMNQATTPIPYPFMGLGKNSNSWAQTVIELAGGKVKDSDMDGIDYANGQRIPKKYFQPKSPTPKQK